MNKLLLFLFILASYAGVAQVTKLKIKKEKLPKAKPVPRTEIHSIDVYYGNLIFKDDFYKQLNSATSINLNSPPRLIGIGFSGVEWQIGPSSHILFQMDVQKYIPESITVNDSIEATFSGARFGMGLGKRFRSANGNFSIACYLGFNSGRTTLKNSENISLQKPFFAPKVSIQPKVMIKRIALSLILCAQGDITSSKWFHTYSGKNTEVVISNLSQTGISAQIGLGYRF